MRMRGKAKYRKRWSGNYIILNEFNDESNRYPPTITRLSTRGGRKLWCQKFTHALGIAGFIPPVTLNEIITTPENDLPV